MRRFSAQYAITCSGPVLKRPVITVDDEGAIIAVHDTGGILEESYSIEFHNGIIIPGFVNSHCHLELSHMKGITGRSKGLSSFLGDIGKMRAEEESKILKSAIDEDRNMFSSGINLCADICNTAQTFGIKQTSRISYINFLEVFGIDPEKAEKRISDIRKVADAANDASLPYWFVPHTVYSLSPRLFRLLRDLSSENRVTSLHFMESLAEKELVESHSGPLMDYYLKSGFITSGFDTVRSHSEAVLNEITQHGNLILVHNTFVTSELIRDVSKRGSLYWCLCPASNLYIENHLPPADLLVSKACNITIGTDSLASNDKLDILAELKLLHNKFPHLALETLISWATINGARALMMENKFGSIEPGKSPGLLLLRDTDLQNMRLLPETSITRLI